MVNKFTLISFFKFLEWCVIYQNVKCVCMFNNRCICFEFSIFLKYLTQSFGTIAVSCLISSQTVFSAKYGYMYGFMCRYGNCICTIPGSLMFTYLYVPKMMYHVQSFNQFYRMNTFILYRDWVKWITHVSLALKMRLVKQKNSRVFCDRWQRQPENSAEYEDQNVRLVFPI